MPLLAVDPARERFDHTCLRCGTTRRGLSPARDFGVLRHVTDDNGRVLLSLAVTCPCGGSEHFNADLTAADEDETAPNNYAFRAEQARHIRALMAHLGLPRHEERPMPTVPPTPTPTR